MPDPRPDVLDFLLTRRSCPAKTLGLPVPGRVALAPILEAAARSPDHGKLEPWRFLVLERGALTRLAALARTRGAERHEPPEKLAKLVGQFAESHLAVVVVAAPRASEKVPEVEQILSAGAVCLAALNAALASGWGANWLTGWAATDRQFLTQGLGLEAPDFIAGFIFIGTPAARPPERPRPDLAAITDWISA